MKLINPQLIAKLGVWLSPIINHLPHKRAIKIYSGARSYFMQKFYLYKIAKVSLPTKPRTLWGLTFNVPLMNSGGMFKNGEGYDLVANQGAGGYIGGTSTHNPRIGNDKLGIHHPFITLPQSHISLNFLGLPNLGDEYLSKHIITANKQTGCPIGWSLMRSSDFSIDIAMEKLIDSLWLYHDKQEIDFIEINESCPNVKNTGGVNNSPGSLDILENRLRYIANNFLVKRKRSLPVILKLSNDLKMSQIPELLDIVLECKFDGINLGNTSTNYFAVSIKNEKEHKLFEYYTKNIGGGVGGKTLKQTSLRLCSAAIEYIRSIKPLHEFHVIRTGGIDSIEDIIDSDKAGISLNQWYTGYFENYIKYGDKLYAQTFSAY